MLPGKGKDNHVLNNCLHEILNCAVHQDAAALLYKVLLSLLFPSAQKQFSEEETWKTTCNEKKHS